MKLLTLITAASSVTATAFAGEPAPMAPAPAPAPTLGGWFVGGTYGQFDADHNANSLDSGIESSDFDFDMYTLHFGRDLGTQVLGCDLAVYFEVGYLDGDASASFQSTPLSVDAEIVPVTINLKAERMFFAGIKGYITAGVGYAFTDYSVSDPAGLSDDDGGFFAQASIGLAYDINEQWEIYGGARWMYLGELDFGVDGFEMDDAIAYEIGLRYSF